MKHELYKMLFDRNPDGSITYTPEDMEKITEEYDHEQAVLQVFLGDSFNSLLDEIEKRITDIAEFAFGDRNHASRVEYDYADERDVPYGFATIRIDLWGENLDQKTICRDGEIINNWKFSEKSDSHTLIFTRKVPREMVTKVKKYLLFNLYGE